jgi:site-specific DNA recombinase
VEAAEGAIVSELFARYVQPGQSLSSLSTHLKQLTVPTPTSKKRWSNGPLRRILTNPVYTGVVYAGRGRVQPAKRRRSALGPVGQRTMTSMPTSKDLWIVVGHIPALVTQESFEQVLLLAQNQSAMRSSQQASAYLPLASLGQLWLLSARLRRRKHAGATRTTPVWANPIRAARVAKRNVAIASFP